MIKQLFFLFLFICSLQLFSQKLIYKSNGNILNSNGQELSPNLVRIVLKENQQLLKNYNTARRKKTIGNILLISGPVLSFVGAFSYVLSSFDAGLAPENKEVDRSIPKIIAFTGLAAIAVAIPVKIGFSKKIRNVVTDYNNQSATGYYNPKLDLITNSNGIGLRLTLNK